MTQIPSAARKSMSTTVTVQRPTRPPPAPSIRPRRASSPGLRKFRRCPTRRARRPSGHVHSGSSVSCPPRSERSRPTSEAGGHRPGGIGAGDSVSPCGVWPYLQWRRRCLSLRLASMRTSAGASRDAFPPHHHPCRVTQTCPSDDGSYKWGEKGWLCIKATAYSPEFGFTTKRSATRVPAAPLVAIATPHLPQKRGSAAQLVERRAGPTPPLGYAQPCWGSRRCRLRRQRERRRRRA